MASSESEEPGGEYRFARPDIPAGPSFPRVLPEDPDERAEVLRQFEEHYGKPRKILPDHLSPAVLPSDPAEMAELLRQFAVWENIPQEARALVISTLWSGVIDQYLPERGGMAGVPAAERLLAAGADPQELSTAMRAAAYAAVFSVLYRIDSMTDETSPMDAPGWMLVEVMANDDGEYESTGRHVAGLHESILGADPSGRDGSDLFS
ncbi:MAG TPA: hypothetical protein VHZ96_17505 [Frankiaceae bacterium]|jgi:hypothetical protein|nr:hypothetical protein [Frankiaceae bacterium]